MKSLLFKSTLKVLGKPGKAASWATSSQPQKTFINQQKSRTMNKDNKDARISIVTRKSDGSKWVRVEALGEDFCIAPKDINDRDDMTYDEAMKALEAAGVTTFDKKQGLLLAIYIEQINAKLTEAGGDAFKKYWYVSRELWKPVGCADYAANYSWFFIGGGGSFDYYYRYNGSFRSRPFLAYAFETFES